MTHQTTKKNGQQGVAHQPASAPQSLFNLLFNRAGGRTFDVDMELSKPTWSARFARLAHWVLVLCLAAIVLRASNLLHFDPAPKGEGSFEEADSIAKQFRDFYRTRDSNVLPKGYIRLEGLGDKDLDGTWVVYYATASHSMVRGGTILLLDSAGRIDTYFGHHCSSADGGKIVFAAPGLLSAYYEGGFDVVRAAFDKKFRHCKTEQVGASDGDKPPN